MGKSQHATGSKNNCAISPVFAGTVRIVFRVLGGLLASLNITAGGGPNSLGASTGCRESVSTRSALAAGEQRAQRLCICCGKGAICCEV